MIPTHTEQLERELAEARQRIEELEALEISLRQLENERLDREIFLNRIIDQSPFATWISDANGLMLRCNSALTEFLNLSKEDLVGKYNVLEDPLVEKTGIMDLVQSVFTEGKTVSFQMRWCGEDIPTMNLEGSNTVDVEATMFPVMDSNGNLTNVVLHWIDVTARKQAEDDLVESRAKLLEAQYIAKIGDFSWEIETGTVSWSDGMHVLLKYDKDEAIDYGRVNREIHHPDDLDMVTKWLLDSIASGVDKLVPREYRLLCKDGDAIWVQTNGRIEYADGKATILFGTCQDISARKRAETEKLTLERQVQHAQKLESLGVLAGGIAHDFNNLLMAILGNSDLALHKLSPMAPARHHIEEIEKATIRAADLAKQMLAYSGKGRFVLEPIQCNELVEEMAHLLKVSISKKAVLKFNPAENLPTFDGDVTQIRQILMNLIINASEAIGEKSGTIALSTGAMHCDLAYLEDVSQTLLGSNDNPLPEGIYIYFEVADTGCGMDDETITNIFDPFFTTKFTGRGLGMSAVLGIVRGHKGAIKVYSEVGRGTTFKILIPANDLSATESGWTEVNEQEGGDWRGSGTVLVVDDEEAICAVGMQMVESMGFSALTAPDGREAVQLFRDNADDIVCVLLDLTMPHMNGEEAFREMRRIKPDAVVILCSGYNEQDATQRFSGKGLAGFIQKPYNLATIKGELMRVLPKSD